MFKLDSYFWTGCLLPLLARLVLELLLLLLLLEELLELLLELVPPPPAEAEPEPKDTVRVGEPFLGGILADWLVLDFPAALKWILGGFVDTGGGGSFFSTTFVSSFLAVEEEGEEVDPVTFWGCCLDEMITDLFSG